MARRKAKSPLEKALETRLSTLTEGLSDAEVTGKGIDIVKEIKELHTLLTGLNNDVKKENPPIVVVWGGNGDNGNTCK